MAATKVTKLLPRVAEAADDMRMLTKKMEQLVEVYFDADYDEVVNNTPSNVVNGVDIAIVQGGQMTKSEWLSIITAFQALTALVNSTHRSALNAAAEHYEG